MWALSPRSWSVLWGLSSLVGDQGPQQRAELAGLDGVLNPPCSSKEPHDTGILSPVSCLPSGSAGVLLLLRESRLLVRKAAGGSQAFGPPAGPPFSGACLGLRPPSLISLPTEVHIWAMAVSFQVPRPWNGSEAPQKASPELTCILLWFPC